MKKIAWPWIGSTEHEMGSGSPDGSYKDRIEESHQPSDGLVPDKSVLDDQASSVTYENGMISPVEDVSLADDNGSEKASVEVSDDEGILANFACNIANTFKDKVSGLQPYSGLADTAGLIFPYNNPEDVIYHMGTVSFPIDIVFIDGDDKIKKIYKDIKPGTLGTFGCANVKNVLEIAGGLSDRLGISVGHSVDISHGKDSELSSVSALNKISSKLGIRRDIIVQYSNTFRPGFHNWKGYPILSVNDKFEKVASEDHLISDLVSKFTHSDNRSVYAFDFDGMIEDSPTVRVYKTSECSDEDIPFIRIDGHAVSIDKTSDGNEIYRDVHLYEIMSNGIESNESILASLNKSFSYFLNDKKIINNATKIFNEVRKAASKSNSRVIVVTRSPNPEYLKSMVCARLSLQFGEPINMEVIKVSKDSDAYDVVGAIKIACGNVDIKVFSDKSLLKRAGTPVPDSVKSRAKRVYKLLDAAKELSDTSLDNMKKNLVEYDKIKADSGAVTRSKGQYNQSVRSNTRIVRNYLIKIRDAIKIFNEIKDISTTSEIIDGLANSAKTASDSIEAIFDLIDEIESGDFHMVLSEKVDEYERVIEDLHSSIDRGMEYINSDILGLLILSD